MKLTDYMLAKHLPGQWKKAEKWLFGRGPKLKQIPTGTEGQQQFGEELIQNLMNMLQGGGAYGQAQQGFGQAQDYLSGLLGPGAFEQFAQPYNQQFEQQVMPRIAERFAGFGNTSGALSSSGFAQALAGGASDFQSKLAQLFTQLQQNAAGQLSQNYGTTGQLFNQQAQIGLGYEPFAYYQQPGSQGNLATLLAALAKAGAGAAGGGF
jgi:hypothetical protein